MAKLFNLEDLREPAERVAGSGILRDNFLDTHQAKVESIKNLNGRLPIEGEIFFLWTINSFNAFTFIPYLVKQCGAIDELVIATYSISTRILNAMTHYLEKGRIVKVHILISDSIKYRIPKVHDQLSTIVAQRSGQVTVNYSWNHSKICLLRTQDGHYLVEGSGNFSENAQHEQYIFMNSKKVFDFRKEEILGIHGRAEDRN